MANRSNATINQTLNYLLAKVNNLPPPPSTETLAQTLTAGNSAGTSDINMNGNNITNLVTLSSTIGNAMNITGDDNLNLSAGGDLSLTGDANVYITASNNSVEISSYDGINISSLTSGINLSTNGTEVSFTNCPINMNLNTINNVSQITLADTTNISSSTLTQATTGDLTINALSNQLILQSYDNTNIYPGVGLLVQAVDYVSLQAPLITLTNGSGFNNTINLDNSTGDIIIQSANGSVEITAGNGDAGNSGITLTSPEGNISLNPSLSNFVTCDSYIYAQLGGFNGPMYHADQPTTASTYYLTFVQSGGVPGYYIPNFDSATLTYNPSTNLLAVAGLQLSGATNIPTFNAGVLTLGNNEASSRQFQVSLTANMTGLSLTNRRTNGVYTCSIYNVSGLSYSISNVLTGSASNKTDYSAPIVIADGQFAILTARTLLTNGTAYNYVSVVKYA